MSRTWERRSQRAVGDTSDLLIQSKWVIWCFERDRMPAMIDLLIAKGRLSESDRPRCVHWSALGAVIKGPGAEIAKLVDAEEMLSKAGIRTVMAEAWEAHMLGPDALKAFLRDRFGDLDSDFLALLDKLEKRSPAIRERFAGRAFHDYGSIVPPHDPE